MLNSGRIAGENGDFLTLIIHNAHSKDPTKDFLRETQALLC
jgi:hypothetical protein